MNYKVGDKFVLEVQRVYKNDAGHTLYGIKGFNALVFDKNGLDKLSQVETGQGSHDIIGRIKKEAYEDGMNEAWEFIKKIYAVPTQGGMGTEDLYEIFGVISVFEICTKNTIQEAKAKIEAWEQKQELKEVKIGDVLKVTEAEQKGIVIQKYGNVFVLLFSDGSIDEFERADLETTDRWVDLEMILDDVAEGFKK